MSRAGDSSIEAGERRSEPPRRGHHTPRRWTIAGLAALLLGAGACSHPQPVIYQPLTPATAAGDPPATAAGPEAAGTGDAPAGTQGNGAIGDPPARPPANREDDERLIASVRRAVAEKVPPDDVVAMVGKKPTVNTRAGLSIAVLRRVTLVPDESHAGERLDLDSAESVIYWARPVDSLDPHFVGIQFRKDGTRALFFAVLLPP